jgi:hypothetical protein
LCFLLSASAEEPKAILTDCFNGCRSIAGLSSENLANDLKIETRTSATESGSSLKVSMFYFSCSVTSCMMPLWRPFQGVVWSLDLMLAFKNGDWVAPTIWLQSIRQALLQFSGV